MSSCAARIQAAITESTREDRIVTIHADDRQAFDWLAETLEALADDTSAEHTRDGDAVREGWGTDPDNVDMTWRVEIVLERGAP